MYNHDHCQKRVKKTYGLQINDKYIVIICHNNRPVHSSLFYEDLSSSFKVKQGKHLSFNGIKASRLIVSQSQASKNERARISNRPKGHFIP